MPERAKAMQELTQLGAPWRRESVLVWLLAFHGGERGSKRRRFLLALAVWVYRLRYWTVGGIYDAGRVAWRADTALGEFWTGLMVLIMGLWWVFVPQTQSNIFGLIEGYLPEPFTFSPILAVLLVTIGRLTLHRLREGCKKGRCVMMRYCFGVHMFLLLNQATVDPRAMRNVFFAMCMFMAYWCHEHICPPGGGCNKGGQESRRQGNKTTRCLPGGDE